MGAFGIVQRSIIDLIREIDHTPDMGAFGAIHYWSATMFLRPGFYDLPGIQREVRRRRGRAGDGDGHFSDNFSRAMRSLVRRGVLTPVNEIPLRSFSQHARDQRFTKYVHYRRTHKRQHRYEITLSYPGTQMIRFVQKGPNWPGVPS